MSSPIKNEERRKKFCRSWHNPYQAKLRLHPLFIAVGVWYCFKGELFLFLLSCLVAVQHECAHAFAAAKLGYKLNKIVLMPFGAVIDGDMRGITFKDEIFVAICGPLCNLITAAFFVAVWWFAPTMYAFTDTAFYSSLAIALVNLLPAYPLDGGRIFKCALARSFLKTQPDEAWAERKAANICRIVTLVFAATFLIVFTVLCFQQTLNFTLLSFGAFLLVGAFGNREKSAVYSRMDFSSLDAIKKGAILQRVALLGTRPVKDTLKYITSGAYLVLEVYDENERHLFDLPQNELSAWFLSAPSPYTPLVELYEMQKSQKSQKL